MHPCTAEDYSQFYDPKPAHKETIEEIKDVNGWMCMDKLDDKGQRINKRLYGENGGTNYRSLAL